jgi:hypothetical protein
MDGLGLLVVVSFVLLTIAIITNTCTDWTYKEGFQGSLGREGPPPTSLTQKAASASASASAFQEPTGISDLPSAPIAGLAENNALPYQDPAQQKGSTKMLATLKADMEGFAASELPGLKSVGSSDPSVSLPITRFNGDYQRVKDEMAAIKNSPGLQPQLAVDDIQDMASNLRFLQRQYRTYAGSKMVDEPAAPLSSVGLPTTEGFTSTSDARITVDQLRDLSTKLSVEIVRLQKSGTNDPVVKSRVNVFTSMLQFVNNAKSRIDNGTLKAADIPIKLTDYQNFLPALGTNSGGIGKLMSASGLSSLSSLFNAYDAGDISGSKIAEALFEKYADEILKGMSYNLTFSYTSPSEVAKEQAIASGWNAKNAYSSFSKQGGVSSGALAQGGQDDVMDGLLDGFSGERDKIRGEFEEKIQQLSRPPSQAPTQIGKFDWKVRAEAVTENIRKAGMNPDDFGCLARGAQVSKDYSWRVHTKMVCSRLATHADPGIPEQMGCPPVSWKGWRM